MAGRAVTRSKPLGSTVSGSRKRVIKAIASTTSPTEEPISVKAASPAKRRRIEASSPPKRAAKKTKVESSDGDARPQCRGQPPVWAMTRGGMNETLDYFRSYQGGMQTNEGFVRGMLLSADNGDRSYLDGELIITRAAGGMADIGGEHKQVKDHSSESAAIRSFLTNIEYKTPFPVILGDKCRLTKAEPPYPFCVMGHFKPVFLWWEKSNECVVAKLRMELLNPNWNSWWVPEGDSAGSGTPNYTEKAQRETCLICHKTQPHIFEQGFVCVNKACEAFWTLKGKKLTDGDTLEYNPAFISERTEWNAEIRSPFSLVPNVLPLNEEDDLVYSTMRAAYKGIVCPQCHGCIQRKKMDGYFCESPGCGYSRPQPLPTLNIRAIEQAHGVQFAGHPIPTHSFAEPIKRRETTFEGPWRLETFDAVEGSTVKQFHSNETINSQPGGPNEMLAQMFKAGLGLERRPMKQSIGQLTSHFSNNFGLPYKYSANVPSTPFAEAPRLVTDALNRMIWAGTKASEDEPMLPLNEVLVLGYYKDQQIGYHDDGEKELGPTIVTFSFGASAKMEIRMKPKYFYGATSKKCDTYDPKQPIIQGCFEPETRARLNEESASWTESKLAAEFKAFKKRYRKTNPPPCFETILRHGDFIVMQGKPLQKYFEHQIANLGDIRFAFTARHVIPELLEVKDQDKLRYGDYPLAPQDGYTGDMDILSNKDQ
ncbi:MAG: hypothetical protein Q9207_006236 [Kuettlingeria erythrocarpa]